MSSTFGARWIDSLFAPSSTKAGPHDAPRSAAAHTSSWWSFDFFTGRSAPADDRALQELQRENAELRAQLLTQQALLEAWTRFVRDVLFASIFGGREEHFAAIISQALTRAVAEVDGVNGVEVLRLQLPASAAWTPSISLSRHVASDVSTWVVEWNPPAEQCSVALRLAGAKLGRKFTVEALISEIRVSGLLRVAIVPWRGEKGEVEVSFTKAPSLDLRVSVTGSWVGAPLKPLIVLLLGRYLSSSCCEPRRIVRALPGLPVPQAHPARSPSQGTHAAVQPGGEAHVADPTPVLAQLLSQQDQTKAWHLDSRLASTLGTKLSTLIGSMPDSLQEMQLYEGAEADAAPGKAWASALVAAVFRVRFHEEVSHWAPAVEAMDANQGLQGAAMDTVLRLGILAPQDDDQPGPPTQGGR